MSLARAWDTHPATMDLWLNAVMRGRSGYAGISARKDAGRVLHAVTPSEIIGTMGKSRRRTVDAPCGVKVRILVEDGAIVLWPPRIADLAPGVARCAECHDATGRRRPQDDRLMLRERAA